MKERALFYIVGLLILTLGVALIIKSGLGASAWDALAVGEATMFSLTVGTCVFINGIVLILMVAIQNRFNLSLRVSRIISEGFALSLAVLFQGAIGVGTIIVTLTLGFFVQYFNKVFEDLLKKMSARVSF